MLLLYLVLCILHEYESIFEGGQDMSVEYVKEQLKDLISRARAEGKWIHCFYQDLWFSPDKFEKAIGEERFIWGLENFELRNPKDRSNQLEAKVEKAKEELRLFNESMENS